MGINRYAARGIVGRGVLIDVDRYLQSHAKQVDGPFWFRCVLCDDGSENKIGAECDEKFWEFRAHDSLDSTTSFAAGMDSSILVCTHEPRIHWVAMPQDDENA